MVESFESIISTYAQQLSLNKTQKFISLSLTVVAVLVSSAVLYYNYTVLALIIQTIEYRATTYTVQDSLVPSLYPHAKNSLLHQVQILGLDGSEHVT